MINLTFPAMGTTIEVVVPEGLREHDIKLSERLELVRGKIFELEALLSRFQPDSEIRMLNAHPGQWRRVQEATLDILVLAKESFQRTNGFFNPCLGGLLEGMGYDVSFETIMSSRDRNNPVFEIPFIAPVRCPYEVNSSESKVFLEPGYKIDLGGIAKGWIVEQAASVLQSEGISQFLINAGGDIVCRGRNGNTPWCVAIADPFVQGRTLLSVDIDDLSVATSGTYRRRWISGGKAMHHILDPFLGEPTTSDVISCTVVHQSIVEAEILAKVALLLGSSNGSKWLKQQGAKGWVMVKNSGEVMDSWS